KVPTARFQLPVELVEDDSRLNDRRPAHRIDFQDLVHVPAGVHHQSLTEGLAILRAAAAARNDREALFSGDADRRLDILGTLWQGDSNRLDLIDRRIRRVAPASKGVEQHLAAHHLAQARREGGISNSLFHRLSSLESTLPRETPLKFLTLRED